MTSIRSFISCVLISCALGTSPQLAYSKTSDALETFQFCGELSVQLVEMGAPVEVFSLRLAQGELLYLRTQSSEVQKALKLTIANPPKQEPVCVFGTRAPWTWAFGSMFDVARIYVKPEADIPTGVTVGN